MIFSSLHNKIQNRIHIMGSRYSKNRQKLDKKQRNNGKSIKHAENRQNAIKKWKWENAQDGI